MKRVLSIQDISCFGKCSQTVALPVISAMGVETVMLPTALLSTHTKFKNFTFKDLTEELIPITEHWKKEEIKFDAIYTGYLGSREEIEIARRIFDEFATKETLIFIDPVMGDNGVLYTGFDEEYARLNRDLCTKGTIIVPNITEACFMTGVPYKEEYDEKYIKELLAGLSEFCTGIAVLTGVSLSEGNTGIYGYDIKNDRYFNYQNDKVNASYHGTGDLFSSVTVGALMNGLSVEDAFKLAADHTALTIRETLKDIDSPWYGVDFEATFGKLIQALENAR